MNRKALVPSEKVETQDFPRFGLWPCTQRIARETRRISLVVRGDVKEEMTVGEELSQHIGNLQRIHGFNSLNLRKGYPLLEIRAPREILSND